MANAADREPFSGSPLAAVAAGTSAVGIREQGAAEAAGAYVVTRLLERHSAPPILQIVARIVARSEF